MKKHISKKRGVAISLALILAIASVIPLSVKAGVVDESTYSNEVVGSDKKYYRTIATNYHAGNVLGLVSITTAADMETAANITKDDKHLGFEPVLFVDDFAWDSDETRLIKKKAEELSATLVTVVDVQLFRWEVSSFEAVKESAIPVRLITGIPKTYMDADAAQRDVLKDYRDYAMIRVHDGEVTVLKDLDDDLNTLTFETDKFSAFGLIFTGEGVIDDYLGNTASTADTTNTTNADPSKPAPAANTELDDVPKTGDILYEIEYGYYK